MRAAAVVLVALLAAPGAAREVAGVDFPERVVEAGKPLVLNGAGLRTRFFFKVYAAGLYLPQPSGDAAAVVHADEPRRVDLRVLRALDGSEIAEAIASGFARNTPADEMGRLRDRLERFEAMFPNVEPGDTIALAYVPGRGTVVTAKGAEHGAIEGKDFADALFAVWLGAHPVDDGLKSALLGR